MSDRTNMFRGKDGKLYSVADLQALATSEWSNSSCLGYVVKALEALRYSPEEIRKVVHEIQSEFDFTSVRSAGRYYDSSSY